MSIQKKIARRAKRRSLRVRARMVGDIPRVSVFRSLNHIYAQLIDDTAGKTLLSCSSLEVKSVAGDKKAVAYAVGQGLAQKAASQGIKRVAFDRGQFLYHGRVKALAEGLRNGGLEI